MIEKDIYKINENFSRIISQDWALLTAGTLNNYNTMTIGWATIGYIWGKNILTCYVRPSRYTYDFMENYEYFTVSFFEKSYQDKLSYLGTHSGRDDDKVSVSKLNVFQIDNGIAFKEARLIFVCKKIYHQDLDKNQIEEIVKDRYYPNNDFHRFYFGEIVKVYEV